MPSTMCSRTSGYRSRMACISGSPSSAEVVGARPTVTVPDSRVICWLSADCTRFRSSAARLMEPSSTTRTKYRNCRSSIVSNTRLTPGAARPGWAGIIAHL